LALIYATKIFRPYLLGTTFEHFTDHHPLTNLKSLNVVECSSRMVRFSNKLQELSFTTFYRKGCLNTNADAFSRGATDQKEPQLVHEVDAVISKPAVTSPIGEEEIRRLQEEDVTTRAIRDRINAQIGQTDNFEVKNGILYALRRNGKSYEPRMGRRLVIPEGLKSTVLSCCHDEFSGAHLGERKTWRKVEARSYWENMHRDVVDWCKSCSVCAAKKPPPPHRSLLHPIHHPNTAFETIGIDFIGPLPTTDNGNKYVLVFTDYTTRWVEAFATSDMEAKTVAKIFVNEIVCRHGAPGELLSNQGRNFLSKLIKEVCDYLKTKKIQTTAYHPQTNGLTERFNGTLCRMLSIYTRENQTDWDTFLPMVLFAYRTSEQETTKESPFRLPYGRDARLPNDLKAFTARTNFVKK